MTGVEGHLKGGGEFDFSGYQREDGRCGVRNAVLVLGLNGLVARAAARIAANIAGTVLFASPYGRGQFGADKQAHTAQLVGLGRNPNVAATVVVAPGVGTAVTGCALERAPHSLAGP